VVQLLYVFISSKYTRASPKVTPPILLYCPVSEADVGGMAVESESSISIPLHFVAVEQMAAEGQSDRLVSDVEAHMEQRRVPQFLHVEKMAPIGIHCCLLNVCGEQTANVLTLRQWVMCFSSGDSNMKDKPCFRWPRTAVTPLNEEHLNHLTQVNWWISEYCVQN